MPKQAKSETLNGRLQQLLLSPKGNIEGLLITSGPALVQVSMQARSADGSSLNGALGKPIELTARADNSPKTKHAAHPVYELIGIKKIAGKPYKSNGGKANGGAKPLRGVVARIHYAKHGEPNGVILESGEFIHARPHGMKKLKLGIGSKVVVHGEPRPTVLGTLLIEADTINRITLD